MQRAVFAVLVTLSLSTSAWADPIRIVGGTFELQNSQIASLSMTGDSRGFTWQSNLSIMESAFVPGLSPYRGGDSVDVTGFFLGMGILDSTVTLDGETFTGIGRMDPSSPRATLHFYGTAPALPMDGTTALLQATFLFMGTFSHSASEELTGRGLATLAYNFRDDMQSWQLSTASYVFQDTLHAPEPASLLLVATGLAYGIRRRLTKWHVD